MKSAMRRVPLSEVMEVERSGIDPSAMKPNCEYIGLDAMDSEGGITRGTTVASAQVKSTKFHFTNSHILFGKLRPYLRKVAAPDFNGICSTDIIPIRPKGNADRRYLLHWLRTDEIIHRATQESSGANLPRISPSILSSFEIPLPATLAEQTRLAAILDQADAIRRKRQQALRLTDDFLRSVFLDFFGDPSVNSKGWGMGTIGDLLQSVNYGTSQKAHTEPDGVPVLRMNNITYSGGWDFTSLKYTIFDEKDREKYLVHNGEMLFNRTNSRELVGKTAVFRRNEPMAYAGYLVRAVESRRELHHKATAEAETLFQSLQHRAFTGQL